VTAFDRASLVHPADRQAWRKWLEENHAKSTGVWLVTGRAGSGLPRVGYDESIEEALCFGWVDSQAATIDEQRSKLYFAPRRQGSPWSRYNKDRVERMLAGGRMTPAGLAVIERAKADGSWSIFDSVDRFELPAELDAALDAAPGARANWDAYPPGVKRTLLSAIVLAKRPETRARKIAQAAELAERNERPPS